MKQREHYDMMIKAITVAIAVVMGIVVVFICQMYSGETLSEEKDCSTRSAESEVTTAVVLESITSTNKEVQVETTLVTEITSNEETTTETTIAQTTTEEETTTKKKSQTTKTTTTQNPTEYINADISSWINPSGMTVRTRIKSPRGFVRMVYDYDSYAHYIQNLELKSYGTRMYEYDGTDIDNQSWCASVIVTEFHYRGWLQCADCVMKLIADYLYEHGRYNDITFDNVQGEELSYTSWAKGDYSRSTYNKYMTEVYYTANTSSLKDQNESIELDVKNIFPGAYFVMEKDKKHKYGHAIFVVDVAKNPDTGEVAFLLAQGSTPSQDMHIFLNPLHPNDPWYYSSEMGDTFAIPFWIFDTDNLYYYKALGIQRGEMETESEPEQTVEQDSSNEDETTTLTNEEATSVPESEVETEIKKEPEDTTSTGAENDLTEKIPETGETEETSGEVETDESTTTEDCDETDKDSSEELTTSTDEATTSE